MEINGLSRTIENHDSCIRCTACLWTGLIRLSGVIDAPRYAIIIFSFCPFMRSQIGHENVIGVVKKPNLTSYCHVMRRWWIYLETYCECITFNRHGGEAKMTISMSATWNLHFKAVEPHNQHILRTNRALFVQIMEMTCSSSFNPFARRVFAWNPAAFFRCDLIIASHFDGMQKIVYRIGIVNEDESIDGRDDVSTAYANWGTQSGLYMG